MNENTARRPAGIHSYVSARFFIFCAVLMASALMVGLAVEAMPAEAKTSPRYERLWDNLSKRDKRWARRVARCESGMVRNAHGGGGAYHGAFQFALRTWRNSPKSPGGDPHRYSFKTQAVVAVYLKKRDGRHHWPHCG